MAARAGAKAGSRKIPAAGLDAWFRMSSSRRPPACRSASRTAPTRSRSRCAARRRKELRQIEDDAIARADPWSKPQAAFLRRYFAHVRSRVQADEETLRARLGPLDSLFDYRAFMFAAPRPLPRAFLRADGNMIRCDCAFWTGTEVLAIEIEGGAAPDPRRQRELGAAPGGGRGGGSLPARFGNRLRSASRPCSSDSPTASRFPPVRSRRAGSRPIPILRYRAPARRARR